MLGVHSWVFVLMLLTVSQCMSRWDVAEPSVTWERLMQNKNKELDRLNGVYMKLLNNAGVEYIEGRGTLVDAHTVEVAGKQYTVSGPSKMVSLHLNRDAVYSHTACLAASLQRH